jgi:hypothetical protein
MADRTANVICSPIAIYCHFHFSNCLGSEARRQWRFAAGERGYGIGFTGTSVTTELKGAERQQFELGSGLGSGSSGVGQVISPFFRLSGVRCAGLSFSIYRVRARCR